MTTATRHLMVLAVTSLMVLCGAFVPRPERSNPTTVAASGKPEYRHVLAISVDGFNPTAMQRLGARKLPHLYWLARHGTSTLNARTAVEQTETLPNHTGMLTGRRISAASGGHGVTFNTETGSTVHRAAGRYVASIFDVVHDRGHRTALFTSKDKFRLYPRSWGARHGAKDRVGVDNGRNKISTYTYRTNEDTLTTLLVRDLRRAPPKFTFWHLADTDRTGHARGYMSPAYFAALRRVDARVGRALRTIRTSPYLSRNLAIVLTSDHGGLGRSHKDARSRHNYRIPFFVWGRTVPGGTNLYRLDRHYRDPGTSQPAWVGEQPLRNTVVANLSLRLLGMPSVPGSHSNDQQLLDPTR